MGSFMSEPMTSEALNALFSLAGRDRSRIATWYARIFRHPPHQRVSSRDGHADFSRFFRSYESPFLRLTAIDAGIVEAGVVR